MAGRRPQTPRRSPGRPPGEKSLNRRFDIRSAGQADLHGAAVARVASWRAAFTGLVPQDFLGYAGVGPERDTAAPDDIGELYALCVHPAWWGSGVGWLLTDAAIADLRAASCGEVWLWVLEANHRARTFYRHYGFTETPDRTHSSLNNLPELRLRLKLRTHSTHQFGSGR